MKGTPKARQCPSRIGGTLGVVLLAGVVYEPIKTVVDVHAYLTKHGTVDAHAPWSDAMHVAGNKWKAAVVLARMRVLHQSITGGSSGEEEKGRMEASRRSPHAELGIAGSKVGPTGDARRVLGRRGRAEEAERSIEETILNCVDVLRSAVRYPILSASEWEDYVRVYSRMMEHAILLEHEQMADANENSGLTGDPHAIPSVRRRNDVNGVVEEEEEDEVYWHRVRGAFCRAVVKSRESLPEVVLTMADLCVLVSESCDHVGVFAGMVDRSAVPLHLECSWQLTDGSTPFLPHDTAERDARNVKACACQHFPSDTVGSDIEGDAGTPLRWDRMHKSVTEVEGECEHVPFSIRTADHWLRTLTNVQLRIIEEWGASRPHDPLPVLLESRDIICDSVEKARRVLQSLECELSDETLESVAIPLAVVMDMPSGLVEKSMKRGIETVVYDWHRTMQGLAGRLSGALSTYLLISPLIEYSKHADVQSKCDDAAMQLLNMLASQASLDYCVRVLWGDPVLCSDGMMSVLACTRWIANTLSSFMSIREKDRMREWIRERSIASGRRDTPEVTSRLADVPPPMIKFMTSPQGARYMRDLLVHIVAEVGKGGQGVSERDEAGSAAHSGTAGTQGEGGSRERLVAPKKPVFPKAIVKDAPFDSWLICSGRAAEVLKCEAQRCANNLMVLLQSQLLVRFSCADESLENDVTLLNLPDKLYSLYSTDDFPSVTRRHWEKGHHVLRGELGAIKSEVSAAVDCVASKLKAFSDWIRERVEANAQLGPLDHSHESSSGKPRGNLRSGNDCVQNGFDVVFIHGVGGDPVLSFVCEVAHHGSDTPADARPDAESGVLLEKGAEIAADGGVSEEDEGHSAEGALGSNEDVEPCARSVGQFALWPSAWLPLTLKKRLGPQARFRVVSVGHEAYFVVRDMEKHTDGTPLQLRSEFVACLLRHAGVGDRPLTLVTHSLGGLIAQCIMQSGSSVGVDVRRLPDADDIHGDEIGAYGGNYGGDGFLTPLDDAWSRCVRHRSTMAATCPWMRRGVKVVTQLQLPRDIHPSVLELVKKWYKHDGEVAHAVVDNSLRTVDRAVRSLRESVAGGSTAAATSEKDGVAEAHESEIKTGWWMYYSRALFVANRLWDNSTAVWKQNVPSWKGNGVAQPLDQPSDGPPTIDDPLRDDGSRSMSAYRGSVESACRSNGVSGADSNKMYGDAFFRLRLYEHQGARGRSPSKNDAGSAGTECEARPPERNGVMDDAVLGSSGVRLICRSILEHVEGLAIISTPHYGSNLVDILSRLPRMNATMVAAEVHPLSPVLTALRLGFALTARGIGMERAGRPICVTSVSELAPSVKAGIGVRLLPELSTRPHFLLPNLGADALSDAYGSLDGDTMDKGTGQGSVPTSHDPTQQACATDDRSLPCEYEVDDVPDMVRCRGSILTSGCEDGTKEGQAACESAVGCERLHVTTRDVNSEHEKTSKPTSCMDPTYMAVIDMIERAVTRSSKTKC